LLCCGEDFDLEDEGPLFAGDEEAVVFGVVGDAVEDGFGVGLLVVGEEVGEVDPGDDVAVLGGDAGNAVGVPDVGVDLAAGLAGDVFELVELVDGSRAFVDGDVAGLGEGVGVAEAEDGGTVAGDELFGGAGDAPAFAVVVELGEGAEGEAIEDEADVGLPGPLDEVGAPVDDAFAEVLGREVEALDGLAGLRPGDEDGGVAGAAGPLVEEAVEIEEAFGVAVGGVGVLVDDFVGVDGGSEAGEGEGEQEGEFWEASVWTPTPGSVTWCVRRRPLGRR
jgi:hypothetical protein